MKSDLRPDLPLQFPTPYLHCSKPSALQLRRRRPDSTARCLDTLPPKFLNSESTSRSSDKPRTESASSLSGRSECARIPILRDKKGTAQIRGPVLEAAHTRS